MQRATGAQRPSPSAASSPRRVWKVRACEAEAEAEAEAARNGASRAPIAPLVPPGSPDCQLVTLADVIGRAPPTGRAASQSALRRPPSAAAPGQARPKRRRKLLCSAVQNPPGTAVHEQHLAPARDEDGDGDGGAKMTQVTYRNCRRADRQADRTVHDAPAQHAPKAPPAGKSKPEPRFRVAPRLRLPYHASLLAPLRHF